MSQIPDKAFILAAGFGTRLKPYTDDRPKPLVEINGKSILMRALDHLEEAGVKEVVINTHYMAEKITDHLKSRTSPHIHFSHEDEILETGGGMKKALHYFGEEPFYAINGDALWTSHSNALHQLYKNWDESKMDSIILLQDVSKMSLTKGIGDYDLDANQKVARSESQTGRYMFTGIRLHCSKMFKNTPDGAFSYLQCMDRAQAQGRLYGTVHDGSWYHISTPKDLEDTDALFRKESR